MSQSALLTTLQYMSIATTLFLVCSLFVRDLYLSYRWFFAFLLVDVGGSIWGLFPVSDPMSVTRYIVGQSLRAIFAAAVVLEIYKLALIDRQAIARAGRKFVVAALMLGLAISVVQIYVQGPPRADQNRMLRVEVLMEMGLGTTLLLLLAVMTAFLSWFPIQLRKNLVFYILGFAGFFAVLWGTRVAMIRVSKDQVHTINLVSFALTQICTFTWIVALTRAGESSMATTAPQWKPERMERLRRRLDQINRDLEGFVR
jgi:hypothetical protein